MKTIMIAKTWKHLGADGEQLVETEATACCTDLAAAIREGAIELTDQAGDPTDEEFAAGRGVTIPCDAVAFAGHEDRPLSRCPFCGEGLEGGELRELDVDRATTEAPSSAG